MRRRPSAWIATAWLAAGCCLLPAAAFAQINGVPNGDFELDADADGSPDQWFSGGAVAVVLGDDSAGGNVSVSSTNGGDWRSQAFPVSPGQTVTFALNYKVSQGATGTARTDLRFFTGQASDGGTSGNFAGEFAPTIDVAQVPQGVWNTWGPFTVTVPLGNPAPLVVPAFGDVRLSAGIFGPALTGTIQWDAVQVTIPEPGSCALAGVASCLLGLAGRRRGR